MIDDAINKCTKKSGKKTPSAWQGILKENKAQQKGNKIGKGQ